MAEREYPTVTVEAPRGTFDFTLPVEPIMIGGQPFRFMPHQERIFEALDRLDQASTVVEEAQIGELAIRLGSPMHPAVGGEKAAAIYRRPAYNLKGQRLEVVMPSEVPATLDVEPRKAVRMVEARTNDRIKTGMDMVYLLRGQMDRRHAWDVGTPVAGAILGPALNLLGSPDTVAALVERGGEGLLAGTAIGLLSRGAVMGWERVRYGGEAERLMQKKVPKLMGNHHARRHFEEPLVVMAPA